MERKLTAILSADVKGYSSLMGKDEVATISTLTAYNELMASLIQQHRGRVVDMPGDNLLAEFASVVNAVQCAVEIQRELKTRNTELPDHRKMEFRIGVNLGDVVVVGERIFGDGVNITARVEELAEGGAICISRTVYEHVNRTLALGYESLGERTLKNIAQPVWVYRIRTEPGTAGPKVSREKKRILLIDDEPSFTRMLKLNLEETGAYEVRTENRGKQGLAAAREFKPDLILLDVIMPGMDGGDVASEIQTDENLKNAPIVFLTAVAKKKDAGIIGGRPFIAKPVTVKEVIDCIEKNL